MPTDKPERDDRIARNLELEIRLILEGAGDSGVRQLEVLGVTPEPGGKVFHVFVGPSRAQLVWGPHEAESIERLNKAKGYIRSELAPTLGLKRCPELSFHADPVAWAVAPPKEEGDV